MHVLTAEQFDSETLQTIFESADHFRQQTSEREGRQDLVKRYAGELLVNLFYEPSTRTRLSFGMAARQLGMGVEGTENAREFSSAAKGETIEDTIRVIAEYSPAIIVLRHHETGGANRAAAVSEVPIINAGDGKGEHPTQALLDLYTIQREKGRLTDLKVVIGGDLANGRTARSLSKMLANYPDNEITFVSIPEFQIGGDIKAYLDSHNTKSQESADVFQSLRDADVVYWTRLQTERIPKPEVDEKNPTTEQIEELRKYQEMIERLQSNFTINEATLSVMPKEAIIMHPLPRVGEIHAAVDKDPRAVYFSQAGNGKYVRMALIDMILKESSANT